MRRYSFPAPARHLSSILAFTGLAALVGLVPISAQAIPGGNQGSEKGQAAASTESGASGSLPPGLLRYKWQPKTTCVYHIHIEADTGVEIETEDGNLFYDVRGSDDLGATLAWRGVLTFQMRDRNGSTRPSARLQILNQFYPYTVPNVTASDKSANEIQVSAQGIRLNAQNRQSLSRAQSELPLLPLELLPDTPKSTWAYSRNCSVVIGAARGSTPSPTVRPYRPGSGSAQNKTEPSAYPAHEETRYMFLRMEGAQALITQQYRLSTQAQMRGQAAIEITGEGQFTFDTALGVPRALTIKFTLTNNIQAEGRSTAVTLACRLLEGAERERALASSGKSATSPAGNAQNNRPLPSSGNVPGDAASGNANSSRNSGRGSVPATPPRSAISDADLDHVLQELRAPEIPLRHAAADRITQAEPLPNRREQVVSALKPLLDDMDNGVRAAAVTAIAAWANLNDGQINIILLHLLTDEDVFIRWATLEAMGKRGTPEMAAGVARCLKKERLASLKSLRQMGEVAAPALLPYLRDAETSLRMDVCRLLKDIGSKSSLPALERTAREDGDAGVRHEALTAIVAIENR